MAISSVPDSLDQDTGWFLKFEVLKIALRGQPPTS